jgi:hypothetical protein
MSRWYKDTKGDAMDDNMLVPFQVIINVTRAKRWKGILKLPKVLEIKMRKT